jgi:hypothetical protein
MSETDLCVLVARHTEAQRWGLPGEPGVNVLELNLELDDEMDQPNEILEGANFPPPRRGFDRLVAAVCGDDSPCSGVTGIGGVTRIRQNDDDLRDVTGNRTA